MMRNRYLFPVIVVFFCGMAWMAGCERNPVPTAPTPVVVDPPDPPLSAQVLIRPEKPRQDKQVGELVTVFVTVLQGHLAYGSCQWSVRAEEGTQDSYALVEQSCTGLVWRPQASGRFGVYFSAVDDADGKNVTAARIVITVVGKAVPPQTSQPPDLRVPSSVPDGARARVRIVGGEAPYTLLASAGGWCTDPSGDPPCTAGRGLDLRRTVNDDTHLLWVASGTEPGDEVYLSVTDAQGATDTETVGVVRQ